MGVVAAEVYRVLVAAAELYAELLAVLEDDRRAHSLAVGLKVERAAGHVPPWLRGDLVAAATLHDIGYGHEVSGFHPLDGARFLAGEGFSPVVSSGRASLGQHV